MRCRRRRAITGASGEGAERMKRLLRPALRWARAVAVALSAALFVFIMVLWAWSYLASDVFGRVSWAALSEDDQGRPRRVRWDFRSVWATRGLLCVEWSRSAVLWSLGPERPVTRKAGKTTYRWDQFPPKAPPATGRLG